MPLTGFGKQPFRFGGKGKGMKGKKWQFLQVNFTHGYEVQGTRY